MTAPANARHMSSASSHLARAFILLAAVGSATYVYRFATAFGSVSLFRLAALVGLMAAVLRWLSAGLRVSGATAQAFPFFGAALIGVTMDWVRLGEGSIHRQELAIFVFNLAVTFLVIQVVRNREYVLLTVRAFVYASLIAIAVGWVGFATGEIPLEFWIRAFGTEFGQSLQYLNTDGVINRITGPFFDPNFMGAYLVFVIGFCFALWSIDRKRLWLLVALACLVTLIFTLSRTALLGLVALALFLGSMKPLDVARRVLVAASILVLGSLIASQVWEGFIERVTDADTSRFDFWRRGVAAFLMDPLFGGSASALEDPHTGFATAHMVYLSVLGKYGIVGGLGMLTFAFGPLLMTLIGKNSDRLSRQLIWVIYGPLAVMYVTYDFLMFLEFQFVLFGVAYAVMLHSIRFEEGLRAPLSPHCGTRGRS